MASGAQRYLQAVQESSWGTLPSSPAMKVIRNTGGSGLMTSRDSLQSAEIRSDRGIVSARLSNQNPTLEIPIELSYKSYDDFLAAALGASWVNGSVYITIEATVDGTAKTITRASGDWESDGVEAGDYLTFAGMDEAANNDTFEVSSVTTTVITVLDPDDVLTNETSTSDVIAKTPGAIYSESVAGDLTTPAGEGVYTRGSGDWVAEGYAVGDMVTFSGFDTAANNGTWEISDVTTTALTVLDPDSDMSAEATQTIDATVNGEKWTVIKGSDLGSFSIEEGFGDLESSEKYQMGLGFIVGTLSLSIDQGAIVTGSINMNGKKIENPTTSSQAGSVVSALDTDPFVMYDGSITKDGSDFCIAQSGSWELNNNIDPKFTICKDEADHIGIGRSSVSGSLTLYFKTFAQYTLFTAETEFELTLGFQDPDGNRYDFYHPRTKFMTESRSVAEEDITEEMNWMALDDTTKGYNIKIYKRAKTA